MAAVNVNLVSSSDIRIVNVSVNLNQRLLSSVNFWQWFSH